MTKTLDAIKSQDGTALITTLVMMGLLMVLGTILFKKVEMNTVLAVTYSETVNAFNAAEAGIQAARTILSNGASNGWEDELASPTLGTDVVLETGKSSYTITVADNSDFDGDSLMDGDDCIFITSVGTMGTETDTIITLVKNTGRKDNWQDTYGSSSLSNVGQATSCN